MRWSRIYWAWDFGQHRITTVETRRLWEMVQEEVGLWDPDQDSGLADSGAP